MSKANFGCPNCHSYEPINFFNWKLAQSPSDENYSFIRKFVPTGKCKFGETYESICCGSKWYLHDGIFMYLINPLRQQILDSWSNRDLGVPDKFKPVLTSIGANLIEGGSISKEYPCRVRFKDGTVSEFTILSLVTLPPDFEEAIDGKCTEKYAYIDEIAEVTKSEFALPISIRKETMKPSEMAMGSYVSIIVSDCHGRAFELSPFENFAVPKLDEPIRILDSNQQNSVSPRRLARVATKRVIADPFNSLRLV